MREKDMMKDFEKMMADLVMEEEKKLGVNCLGFIRRHNEIMEMAGDMQRR